MQALNSLFRTYACLLAILAVLPAQGAGAPKDASRKGSTFERRLASVAPGDAAGYVEVATWARSRRLFGDMRRAAKLAIAIDPDHARARLYLGEMKVNGRWLKKSIAMKELGYVRYKARWYTLDEYAKLRAEEGARRRRARLDREVNRLVRRLGARSDKIRTQARDDLLAFAKKEDLAGLAPRVNKLHDELANYWARVRALEAATVEVRLQKADLIRMRQFRTSLGTGSPVTLELPEVRRASIGTTVLVPVGR